MEQGRAPGGYLTAQHARWLAERPDRRWQALDGTLLFADVSGFTVLGEKLARQGRIGAEILSDTVNTVFAGMLDVVTDEGGEILKFGGDAVLALFSGPDHAIRGCSAGLGMQAMLRALRRERSVNLRLSAGVATGTAHLFLAGASPREMIVAGPLATEVLTQEAAAEAGQVLVSPATAAALPARCVTDGRLRTAPAVAPAAPPALPDRFDPRPGLPLHLHGHEPGDAEHRAVTVAFVQFRGTDALLAAEGPDALAYALDDVIGAAADAALAHGVTFVGTDVDRDAGKIILAAGAPTASPDDEDRMLHALRAIVGAPRRLAVRAGVNRGRVFTVDIGPERRRTWTVMGDDVNLAARVMGRSEPGSVLATRPVLARLRDDFARTPVPPFTVKGKSAPVFAEEVGEARGARRTETGGMLVGREREMAELREALTEARLGAHRVIEMVGEPGIGKSRLVEAITEDIGATPRVLVQGGPYAAHSSYRAVRMPLRTLLGCTIDDGDDVVAQRLRERAAAAHPRFAAWLPLVGIPFGLELEPTPETASLAPGFARARLNDWTVRLVDALLPEGPSALVVEDAHWLDDASSDLIAALVRRRRPGGSLVLLTRREGPGGLRVGEVEGAVTLAVGPLPPSALSRMANESADDDDAPLPPGAEHALVERAAGNPLLLQELLAAARAGERLDTLPDTVEALITARIDTLPRGDRRLLREAAVLGAQISPGLLGQLLELDAFAVQAALRRLDDFLVPGGPQTVRFRHGLLRDAAYETLPYRRRRELHGRAAGLIERTAGARAEDQAELLALHYHAARRWPETWRWARVAADQSLRRAAPVEAAGFLSRALDAGRALPATPSSELAGVAERLGDAARLGGRPEAAAAAYGEARRRMRGDAVAEAKLCLKTGRLGDRSRHVSQSLRWYTRGLHTLEALGDDPAAVRVRAQLTLAHGATRLRAGRLKECVPLLRAALDGAAAIGDKPTLAHGYFLIFAALSDLGDPEADAFRELPLPIYQELGDHAGQAMVLNNLGIDAYYRAHWDEAVDLYERSRVASEHIGDAIESATALNNIAEIRSDQGRFEEAEELLREALQTFRASGFGVGEGIVWSNLGRLAARRGDLDGARDRLARARTVLESIGSDQLTLEVDAREAERMLFAGDRAGALRLAGAIRLRLQQIGEVPTLMAMLQRMAGYAKLQSGAPEEARARFGESAALARRADAPYEEALALEALGRMGDEEAAAAAAAVFTRLGVVATAPTPLPV